MNILTKTLVLSIIVMQGILSQCAEEEKKQSTLNQNIKTGLILSAVPAAAWIYAKVTHNFKYWYGVNDPYNMDLSVRRPFLKLLKPDRIEIATEDVLHEGIPLAKRWWVTEYVIEATDTNIERLGKVDFEHTFGKTLKKTCVGAAGLFVAKGLYDSYKEYRDGNFIKAKKKE